MRKLCILTPYVRCVYGYEKTGKVVKQNVENFLWVKVDVVNPEVYVFHFQFPRQPTTKVHSVQFRHENLQSFAVNYLDIHPGAEIIQIFLISHATKSFN